MGVKLSKKNRLIPKQNKNKVSPSNKENSILKKTKNPNIIEQINPSQSFAAKKEEDGDQFEQNNKKPNEFPRKSQVSPHVQRKITKKSHFYTYNV